MLSDRFKNVIRRLEKAAENGELDFSMFKYGMSQLRDLTERLRNWENSATPGTHPLPPSTSGKVIDFAAEQRKRDRRHDH